MALDSSAILNVIVSHSLTTGYFDRVNTHEPKNPPGNGITTAVWFQSVGPAPRGSSLQATSARLVFTQRIYQNMTAEPQDEIDPEVLRAVDSLMRKYSGDFDLGGNVRCVDLLGMAGIPLQAQAGYVNIGGKLYRVVDITLPLIVNDVWDQVA